MERKWVWLILFVVATGVAVTVWVDHKKAALESPAEPKDMGAPMDAPPLNPSTASAAQLDTNPPANAPVTPMTSTSPPGSYGSPLVPDTSSMPPPPTTSDAGVPPPPPPPPNYQYPENYDPDSTFPSPTFDGPASAGGSGGGEEDFGTPPPPQVPGQPPPAAPQPEDY